MELYLQSPSTPPERGDQLKHRDNFTFYLYLPLDKILSQFHLSPTIVTMLSYLPVCLSSGRFPRCFSVIVLYAFHAFLVLATCQFSRFLYPNKTRAVIAQSV